MYLNLCTFPCVPFLCTFSGALGTSLRWHGPQVEAVRLAASKALVVLATDVSAVLVVALGSICQRVNAILTHNKPSLTVRTYLLELLVRITTLPDIDLTLSVSDVCYLYIQYSVCLLSYLYSGRQTCGRNSRGYTGGRLHRILHLPSVVIALIFLARRIQPFPFPCRP